MHKMTQLRVTAGILMQKITQPNVTGGLLIQNQVLWDKIEPHELAITIMVKMLDGVRNKNKQKRKYLIEEENNKEIKKKHKEEISECTKEVTCKGRE